VNGITQKHEQRSLKSHELIKLNTKRNWRWKKWLC